MTPDAPSRPFATLVRSARTAQLLLLIACAATIVIGLVSVARDAPLRAVKELELLRSIPSFEIFQELAVKQRRLNPPWSQPTSPGKALVHFEIIVGPPKFFATPDATAPRAIVWANPITVGQYSESLRLWPRYSILEPTNLVEMLNSMPASIGCTWVSVTLECGRESASPVAYPKQLKDGTPVFDGRTEAKPLIYAVDASLVLKTCPKMRGRLQCAEGQTWKEAPVSGYQEVMTVTEPGPIHLSALKQDSALHWYLRQLAIIDRGVIREVLPRVERYRHLVENIALDAASARLEEMAVMRSEAVRLMNVHIPELPFIVLAPSCVFLSLLYARGFVKQLAVMSSQGVRLSTDRVTWICLLPGWEAEVLILASYVILPTAGILALIVRANWGLGNYLAVVANGAALATVLALGGHVVYLLARVRVHLSLSALPAIAVRALRFQPPTEGGRALPEP